MFTFILSWTKFWPSSLTNTTQGSSIWVLVGFGYVVTRCYPSNISRSNFSLPEARVQCERQVLLDRNISFKILYKTFLSPSPGTQTFPNISSRLVHVLSSRCPYWFLNVRINVEATSCSVVQFSRYCGRDPKTRWTFRSMIQS